MSWKLKLLGILNVLGWVVVVPVLMAALLHPFVDFRDWPGGFLLDRPAGEARLHDGPGGSGGASARDERTGRGERSGPGRTAAPALRAPQLSTLVAPVPVGDRIVNVPVAPVLLPGGGVADGPSEVRTPPNSGPGGLVPAPVVPPGAATPVTPAPVGDAPAPEAPVVDGPGTAPRPQSESEHEKGRGKHKRKAKKPHHRATPAIPATPAVPGVSPAVPATPAVPASGPRPNRPARPVKHTPAKKKAAAPAPAPAAPAPAPAPPAPAPAPPPKPEKKKPSVPPGTKPDPVHPEQDHGGGVPGGPGGPGGNGNGNGHH